MILHIEDRYSEQEIYVFYRDHYIRVPKIIYQYGYAQGKDVVKLWKGMEQISLTIDSNNPIYERKLSPKLRYINDNKLYPNYKPVDITSLTFDIEVYNRRGFPDPNHDKIISIAYVYEGREEVISEEDEGQLISKFFDVIRAYDPDILVGYNIEEFDLPYLLKRAKLNNIDINSISRYDLPVLSNIIPGRIIFDVYNLINLMSKFSLLDLDEYSLSHVYYKIFNEKKIELDRERLWEIWDRDKKSVIAYNLSDAKATDRIYKKFLPLILELSNLSKMYLQDLIRSYSSKIVENLIIAEGYDKFIIPDEEYREEDSYQGGYVLTPNPGVYNNIAVLDFASMYPSIIVSNNIDYYTYKDGEFLKSPLGLIPSILKNIIEQRLSYKAILRERKDPGLEAKVQALKILANSFYGYMAYRRSRFYIKEGAEKVTQIGREMIKNVISIANQSGFQVIYADTDSVFLLYKDENDVYEFLDRINNKLEGMMRLELEDLYVRGLFVAKRDEEIGAKKKYALLSKDGKIKVRGFELLRRDWCQLAREAQQQVLKMILIDNNPSQAIEYVKNLIDDIRNHKIDYEKLVIYNRLYKKIGSYQRVMPEVAAAKKLVDAGWDEKSLLNRVIRYIIVDRQGRIADKAEPLELYLKNNLKYDPEYYIEHQLLPAITSILSSLGYNDDQIKSGFKQHRLL